MIFSTGPYATKKFSAKKSFQTISTQERTRFLQSNPSGLRFISKGREK
jgi:hypothetical protein